jgi:DNA replication protein DnaC
MTTENERLLMDSEPQKLFTQTETRVVTRNCEESGKEFTLNQTRYGDIWFPEIKYCDEVLQRHADEERREGIRKRNEMREEIRVQWIDQNIPYYFKADLDRSHELDWRAVNQALKWKYSYDSENQSLVLKGETRKGKTRSAYEIIKKNALLFPYIDTAERIARKLGASLSESTRSHEKNIQHLCNVKLLCIDDLGKEGVTHRTQTDLFEIINRRLEHNRPTIITTNFDGESLLHRFPDEELARPLIARIREYKVIEFN